MYIIIQLLKMMYIVCPTCGEILGNKEIVYEEEMRKICDELNIDINILSKGLYDQDIDLKKRRAELVKKLCKNICCRQHMLTCIDTIDIIKGSS